jgi:hypothetical protein
MQGSREPDDARYHDDDDSGEGGAGVGEDRAAARPVPVLVRRRGDDAIAEQACPRRDLGGVAETAGGILRGQPHHQRGHVMAYRRRQGRQHAVPVSQGDLQRRARERPGAS